MVGNDYTDKLICGVYTERDRGKVIMTTSISFYLGIHRRCLPTYVIKSRVGKVAN